MTTVMIVGGTSGVGLELAKLFAQAEMDVYVTGREDPLADDLHFVHLDLSTWHWLPSRVKAAVMQVPQIDLFIYAAGFYQEGRLDELDDVEIDRMMNVGLAAPVFLLRTILRMQDNLEAFIAITSTSQWTPRLLEPVYTAVKAGLAALAHSVSLDERVQQVLVAGPAAMATPFWDEDGRDTTPMLDPAWVAEQITAELARNERYREVAILRDPARVEERVSEK